MIYFDNSSSAFPKAPGVGEKMMEIIVQGAVNVNRGTYQTAYNLEMIIYETREMLSKLFNGGKPSNVIFTPSITYSLNYFIKGYLKKGDHIIISGLEHNAVMRPLAQMKELGIEYSVAHSDEKGNTNAEAFKKEIKENTRAIITLHGSNVCGTVMPIEDIGRVAREAGLKFVVDTAQTAGILPIDMQAANIDFLAFTGHKGLLGPQGIGGFIIEDGLASEMEPLITGGTGSASDSIKVPEVLPDKFESGTPNIPGIIGLNTALKYLGRSGIKNIFHKEMELTQYFISNIKKITGVSIAGNDTINNRVAVVSLDFKGMDNSEVAFFLDSNYGICTRVGLHCAPEAHKVLGTYPEGTVRFSFGHMNTKDEIDICVKAIKEIMK